MGVSNFIVFCAIFVVISCNKLNEQNKPNNIIHNAHFKRETESDRPRNLRVTKIPNRILTQPTNIRINIPNTKNLNAQPINIIPKRNMIRVVEPRATLKSKYGKMATKHILSDNKKNKTLINNEKTNDDSTKNNDIATKKDTKVDYIITTDKNNIPVENTLAEKEESDLNVRPTTKSDISIRKPFIEEEEEESLVNEQLTETPDTSVNTTITEKENNIMNVPSIKEADSSVDTSSEENENTVENIPDVKSITRINEQKESRDETRNLIEEEKERTTDFANQSMSKIENSLILLESHSLDKENLKNTSSSLINIPCSIPINIDVTPKSTNISPDVALKNDNIPISLGPARILSQTNKHIPFDIKPRVKLEKISQNKIIKKVDPVCFIPQPAAKCGTKIENNEKEVLKNLIENSLPKIDDSEEEIVVNNHNYEEYYEAPVLQSIIASDIQLPNNWNSNNPITSNGEKNEPLFTSLSGSNFGTITPYLYDIKKYPNEYVINTYNNDNYKTLDAIYQNYRNQAQAAPYKQWGYLNQGQNYYNRIRRIWNNNQIVIKPKVPVTDAYLSNIIRQARHSNHLKNI